MNIQTLLYIFLAFFMGAAMSVYLPMNGVVSKIIGSSITANVIFFLVAFLISLLIFFLFGEINTIPNIKKVPFVFFLSGFFGGLIVLGMTFLIPRIGAGKFFIALITGQILMAIIVSNYGILSSPQTPITLKKIMGAILVVFGAIISIY
jgi:bacterial/archaeal transporter family-2 protein